VNGQPPISEGANPETAKVPSGATAPQGLAPEMHIHIHPNAADSGDDNTNPMIADPDAVDPSLEEEDPEEATDPMDPSDVDQTGTEASPMAQQIAQTHVDPLGATKKTFGKLTKAKLAYDQAKEEAKRSVIPAMSVLQHVSNAHGLQPAMPGMGMDPNNPDATMGYDPNQNPPGNMMQSPGMQQMTTPQNSRMAPGASPAIPGGQPGNAATGSQRNVVPPKMGVPKPGQSQTGTKAGKPGEDAEGGNGKKVKVEVHGSYSRKQSKIEAAAALHNLRFIEAYGTSEGASKGWDTRGRGSLKQVDTNNFAPAAGVKYVDHSDIGDPEESASKLKGMGYRVHKSTWIDQAGKANAEDAKDNFVARAHSRGHDVVHSDIGQDGYLLHEVSVPERIAVRTPPGVRNAPGKEPNYNKIKPNPGANYR